MMINTNKFYKRLQLSLLLSLFLSLFLTLGYSQETEAETSEELIATHTISGNSTASFSIFEVLLGNDKTVVGTTSLVTGDLSFDLANPQATQLGSILIDARGFETDDNRRNGAIQRRVLNTSQEGNEYISFETTSIEGLPETVAIGDSFEVMITGDLTIVGTTLEQTFAVTITVNSETELEGLGTATILYETFGLTIPKVPVVARVADELTLEIAFVAGPPPVVTE